MSAPKKARQRKLSPATAISKSTHQVQQKKSPIMPSIIISDFALVQVHSIRNCFELEPEQGNQLTGKVCLHSKRCEDEIFG